MLNRYLIPLGIVPPAYTIHVLPTVLKNTTRYGELTSRVFLPNTQERDNHGFWNTSHKRRKGSPRTRRRLETAGENAIAVAKGPGQVASRKGVRERRAISHVAARCAGVPEFPFRPAFLSGPRQPPGVRGKASRSPPARTRYGVLCRHRIGTSGGVPRPNRSPGLRTSGP